LQFVEDVTGSAMRSCDRHALSEVESQKFQYR
jgi:hypothetical protein